MDYSTLVETYERLEATSSKLAKTRILAELLKRISSKLLSKVVLLVQGVTYPKFMQMEIGIARKMMIRAISKATGIKLEEVVERFKKTGDLGLAAETCIKSKKQVTLLKKKLTIDFVFDNIQKLALITGVGSQERKLKLIAQLLVSSRPNEAKYIVRTILGELRVGTAEGIIRDGIVEAFLIKKGMSKDEKKKLTEAVNYAWNILSDFGEVAKITKEKRLKGLNKVKVELGKPIHVMLGLKAEDIEEVVKKFGKIVAEYKYDGMRCQIHKKGERIWVYTRRLEDVTKQFPDIVKLSKQGLKTDKCIVEGEILAISPKTGLPLPFQMLSQRIQRKYEIERMTKEIPIQVHLFDLVYLDGELFLDKPLTDRRKGLEKIVKPITKNFGLARQLVTEDLRKIKKFYKEALQARQEGVFLKVPDSKYVFGRHVGGWYKIKPVMETLDLVIVGATWGEGARANWLTSYVLACRDPDTGKFLECGMMSTGLTEAEYKTMTKTLKSLVIEEKGRRVRIKPKIVLEAGYQEIQKSPNYKSGFALRFPRLIKIRDDKGPSQSDTIQRVKELFRSQGRRG